MAARHRKYRVFVSYSHEDIAHVRRIVAILKRNGLTPMWDRGFSVGQPFDDQIRRYIAHAHVFLPVITAISQRGSWVHQEIGYAMALDVPVLPVALDVVPGQMIQRILAVRSGANVRDLRKALSWNAINRLVQAHRHYSGARCQCADYPAQRAELMARHANDVAELGELSLVRQKGGLSSFHIPNKSIDDDVWKSRYGKKRNDPLHNLLQQRERMALEEHARAKGCRLIVDLDLDFRPYGGVPARIVRLSSLLEFLKSMPDEKCRVAVFGTAKSPASAVHRQKNRTHDPHSVTLVGDWFCAESVAARPGVGYFQTVFTRHAPSLIGRVEAFDLEFQGLLANSGWTAKTSRRRTMAEIEKILRGLHGRQ